MKTSIGATIGDFGVIQKLGADLFGVRYLAEHRYLKRLFILRELPQEMATDARFITRFENEVRLSGALEHPHIIRMHDATNIDGAFYIISEAMEERADLNAFLNSHPDLTEEEIFQIAGQMASAIDYAHAASVVHGGIRLANVLVDDSNGKLSVLLDEFALTRVIGAVSILRHLYSHVAELNKSFLLDFAFLAPEQREGKDDPRSDVYAFGVLLYYLLMKRIPEGFFEMPSARHRVLKYNWDLLLFHCLQQDKEKRPSSLLQSVQDLLAPKTILPAILSELKPVLNPTELTKPEFIDDPASLFVVDTVVGRYQPQAQEVTKAEPLLTDMAIIHGGHYLRGSQQGGRDEIPRHQIILKSFAIDTHPISNEQFARFLEAMGGEKDVNNNDMIRLRDSRIKRSAGKINIESGYAKHPVVGVSWYGAVAYAKWVGKRLPTEAEWEIAATGGSEENVYPTGKEIERSQANFFSSDTTAVMSYPANGYGLYDMAGNVYEWCYDWYEFHYYDISVQEPQDPKGPLQGNYRVLRGGCWKSLKEDLRCAHRHRNNPGTMNATYGFRCAADVS